MSDFWEIADFSQSVRDYEFTRRAVRDLNDVVYSAQFEDMDTDAIFDYLFKRMELISFKDYLKRYIYERAQIREPFRDIPDDVYIDIIISSFKEYRHAPVLRADRQEWRAVVKEWMSHDSVKRPTIFLLGFGLKMSAEDVSEFLTKVIKEEDFNLRDPDEVIYLYCYRNGLKFLDAQELREAYAALPESEIAGSPAALLSGSEAPQSRPASASGRMRRAAGRLRRRHSTSVMKRP